VSSARRVVPCVLLAPWLLCSCATGRPEAGSSRRDSDVTLHWMSPTSETRTFDRFHPPSDMPPLRGEQASACESQFKCNATVTAEVAGTVVKFTSVDATLNLHTVLWLPENATAKMRAHIAGRREISQRAHARGRDVANPLAREYLGQTRTLSSGVDATSAADSVLRKTSEEFCNAYLDRMQALNQAAQDRYSTLTDFGRNSVSEADAIEQATASTP
jgi:hypothetical protein